MIEAVSLPPALVMGLSPTGLHVVRTLGRAGVKVFGLAEGRQSGSYSRHLVRCLSADGPAGRLAALCDLFPEVPDDQPGKPVLIPTSDQDVDLLIENADVLSRRYRMQESYRDGTAARILSKESFYELCRAHGVAYPRLWKAERESLAALAAEITFPCLIKPSRIHDVKEAMRGRKVWIAKDPDALRRVADTVPDGAGTLLVQEIVPGPESNITLFCAHVDGSGHLHQSFTARKLRQFPPGFGSASLVQSSVEDDTARISADLLSAIGYTGIAALEFKRHPTTGELYIIEMNTRTSLWFGISEAAGRSVVLSAYRELARAPDDLPERQQIEGVRWRYQPKDAASALFYITNPSFVLPPPVTGAVGPARKSVGAVLALDDPAPAAGELANLARKALGRAWPFRPRAGVRN